MSRNLDERRVYELMEQPMSRYEPQAQPDYTWAWLAVGFMVLMALGAIYFWG